MARVVQISVAVPVVVLCAFGEVLMPTAEPPRRRLMNPQTCSQQINAAGSVSRSYESGVYRIALTESMNPGTWESNTFTHMLFSPQKPTSGHATYARLAKGAHECLTTKLSPGGHVDFIISRFKEVPFVMSNAKIDNRAEREHFAYSGCVYSEKGLDLIRELGGSWLMHEYAHVYHLAVGESGSPEAEAVKAAYAAAVARKTEIMGQYAPPAHHFDDYAFANFMEYFAVLTEALCHSSGVETTYTNHWPQNDPMLVADDPQGRAAVLALWRMSKANQEKWHAKCKAASGASGNRHMVGISHIVVAFSCFSLFFGKA